MEAGRRRGLKSGRSRVEATGVSSGPGRLPPLIVSALLATALIAPSGAAAAGFGSRPLKMGMHGHDVSVLQKFLTKLGFETTRDGIFGAGTRHNVKRLEKHESWKVNGVVSRKDAKRIRKLIEGADRIGTGVGKYFFYGASAPQATISATLSGTVGVDVLDGDGAGVMSLDVPVSSGAGTATWYGRGSDGRPAADGEYSFSISDDGGTGAQISGGETGTFWIYGHIFPVRGPHDYGGSGARFGAPRVGHIHQGQDVPAACGTKLVAVQGGEVIARAYQASGAGNYVVIEEKGSGKSDVYMHLNGPGPLSTGDTVRTGQRIGKVGATGDAQGCHLHFERWTAPGWYQGGHPYDPLPSLQYWDSYS